MSARPVPHIGATMTHRATLYQLQQRELERMLAARRAREAARAARFAKHTEPVQMCAVEDVPAAVSPLTRWTLRVAFSLVLTVAFAVAAWVVTK